MTICLSMPFLMDLNSGSSVQITAPVTNKSLFLGGSAVLQDIFPHVKLFLDHVWNQLRQES